MFWEVVFKMLKCFILEGWLVLLSELNEIITLNFIGVLSTSIVSLSALNNYYVNVNNIKA